MSEYEMVDLFLTWGIVQEEMVERFIMILFAFLFAAYFVSDKLKPILVTIVVTLYSYMALRYVFFYVNVFTDQIALAQEIVSSQDNPESALKWLEVPPNVMRMIYYSQAVAMLVSYLASIFFFFYIRQESKGATGAAGT